EQEQKQKQARKHQQQITVREIKFRPQIAQHDYETKKGHVERVLRHQDKVKVTIMFRGREVTHPERGEMILTRLADELAELAVVEQRPIQDGRNMTMMLAPAKAAGSDAKPAKAEAGASGSDGGDQAAKPEDAKPEDEKAEDVKPQDAKADTADEAKPAKAAAAGAKPKG
ncbi:MAG: translation initiation factor, partial [Solirubrobacteraceae bacterium]|nr:translation initiation factor [Solirubrobacteraceae bacterium]